MDAALVQAEQRDCCGSDRHHRKRSGHALGVTLQHHQQGDGADADDERQRLHLTQLARRLADDAVHVVTALDVHAEKMLELAEADDQRRRRGEAAHHRVRQEVDQEPQATDAHGQLHGANHGGERDRVAEIGFGIARSERGHASRYHQRHHGHRTDGELPRGPEDRVDHQRQRRGIEAGDRGKPREHRVGHALRDEHHGDGKAGRQVAAKQRLVVAA